jgi:hypothetical protein
MAWMAFEETMIYNPPGERRPEPKPKHTVYTVNIGDPVYMYGLIGADLTVHIIYL